MSGTLSDLTSRSSRLALRSCSYRTRNEDLDGWLLRRGGLARAKGWKLCGYVQVIETSARRCMEYYVRLEGAGMVPPAAARRTQVVGEGAGLVDDSGLEPLHRSRHAAHDGQRVPAGVLPANSDVADRLSLTLDVGSAAETTQLTVIA